MTDTNRQPEAVAEENRRWREAFANRCSTRDDGAGASSTVLELTVNDHPGVMSHVCGLFARRAFNVDAILCLPEGDGMHSRIRLRVHEDERLEQVIRQLEKLEDVLEVSDHHGPA
jgi:acetolactate synthase-1/3 small subunit